MARDAPLTSALATPASATGAAPPPALTAALASAPLLLRRRFFPVTSPGAPGEGPPGLSSPLGEAPLLVRASGTSPAVAARGVPSVPRPFPDLLPSPLGSLRGRAAALAVPSPSSRPEPGGAAQHSREDEGTAGVGTHIAQWGAPTSSAIRTESRQWDQQHQRAGVVMASVVCWCSHEQLLVQWCAARRITSTPLRPAQSATATHISTVICCT